MKKEKKNPFKIIPGHVIQAGGSLRHEAEEQYKKKQSGKSLSTTAPFKPGLSETDNMRLLHELETYQIKLEMQNTELRQAVETAAASTALYNFAPVGYFTLNFDGSICMLNHSGARLLGKERSHLVNSNFKLFIAQENRHVFNDFLRKVFKTNSKHTCEVRLTIDGNPPSYVHLESIISEDKQKCLLTAIDITENNRAKEERIATNELLNMINSTETKEELIKQTTYFLKKFLNCEAIGIRLHEEVDFPYFKTIGFPEIFVKAERYLCSYDEKGQIELDNDGNPVLECMCGNILRGRIDPSKPFFTAHGSFWSNCTTELLSSTTEADRQAHTRNRCNSEGYESVGLFPLRSGTETFGLLQVNDKRKGFFTPGIISFLEQFGDNLAIALSQHRTKEALQDSANHWQTTFDAVNDGICLFDSHQHILRCNKAMYNLFPESGRGMIGKPCWEVVHGTNQPIPDCPLLKMKKTLQRENTEQKLREKWFDVTVDPFFDAENRLAGAVHILRDISDKKKTEEALKENFKYLETVLNTVVSGITLSDLDGHFELFNHRMEEITGYTKEEANQDNVFFNKLYSSVEQYEKRTDTIRKLLNDGGVNKEETQLITKSGEIKSVVLATSILMDNKPKILCAYHDITERKLAEEAIVENESRLRELNATKDKFFSIIAHDLKSPFNSIMGFSDLLLEDIQEKNYDGIEKYAGIIHKSSQMSLDLLMNLMEWSRSQTGILKYNPKSIEIGVLIDEVTKLLRDSAQQKSITISHEGQQDLTIFADEAMISTIFRNLISNAIKFTHPGGTIVISAEQNQDECLVTVSDNGVGMKKEALEKLFRIDVSYSTMGTQNEKGTGLGLLLCKEFITKHGGKIWVESEVGNGSKFCFTIPKV